MTLQEFKEQVDESVESGKWMYTIAIYLDEELISEEPYVFLNEKDVIIYMKVKFAFLDALLSSMDEKEHKTYCEINYHLWKDGVNKEITYEKDESKRNKLMGPLMYGHRFSEFFKIYRFTDYKYGAIQSYTDAELEKIMKEYNYV